jgi:leucyl aminopeptidase (aminopeptidase T)
MMRSVDVVVCPTTKSLTHTNARREASRVGVRIATLPDASPDSLIRCINDSYDKVADTCRIVANALKGSTVVKVTTKQGTDISFSSFETRIMQNTGLMRNIGENGNLPAGEVFLAPVDGSMNGTIVFDASFGSIGLLDDNVKIIIKDSTASRFYGKATGKAISAILKQFGDDALKIGEFGIGTNHTAQISGNIVEDEKVLGTVHFAFGNNLAMGGKIAVPIHLDGVVRNPDIYVDGNLIMKDGVLQLHDD